MPKKINFAKGAGVVALAGLAVASSALLASKKARKVKPLDYTDESNWVRIQKDGTKDVDVFFVYPTIVMESPNGDFATIDEQRESAEKIYELMTTAYADYANVYMPLYRQVTFAMADKCKARNGWFLKMLYENVPYADIEAAIDYYFENFNNGRPFIIAAHSQGSALVLDVLYHYMQEHPEYLERMVAAYALGYAPSASELQKYPNLKFATGELDTGVIVSWNTEGAQASGKSVLLPKDPLVINPLNWKTDDTYAGPELCKGCQTFPTTDLVEGYADAQINLARGTVVCTKIQTWTEAPGTFQNQSLHEYDYALYYVNLKENVKARIEAFLAKWGR